MYIRRTKNKNTRIPYTHTYTRTIIHTNIKTLSDVIHEIHQCSKRPCARALVCVYARANVFKLCTKNYRSI